MRLFNLIITRAKNVDPSERLSSARQLILEKCDFLVDVGANDGQWVSDVKRQGFKGNVLCIEPLKESYIKLKSRKLNNVTAINCAVGNMDGVIYLNKASNNGLSSSILELNSYHIAAAPEINYISKEKVKIVRMSKILKAHRYKKIFVKIDTQGYEIEVIRGLNKKNFSDIYGFQIEVNLVETYKSCTLIENIIEFLNSKGYRPFRIENGFGMPKFGQQLQADILFIKV